MSRLLFFKLETRARRLLTLQGLRQWSLAPCWPAKNTPKRLQSDATALSYFIKKKKNSLNFVKFDFSWCAKLTWIPSRHSDSGSGSALRWPAGRKKFMPHAWKLSPLGRFCTAVNLKLKVFPAVKTAVNCMEDDLSRLSDSTSSKICNILCSSWPPSELDLVLWGNFSSRESQIRKICFIICKRCLAQKKHSSIPIIFFQENKS